MAKPGELHKALLPRLNHAVAPPKEVPKAPLAEGTVPEGPVVVVKM